MARTIMVSNLVYEELAKRKEKKSFSELILELLSANKNKKGSELRECLGLLKKDKESEEVEKKLKRGWKNWNKKYV